MTRTLFINLAATDLKASTDFYLQLGFGFHPQFSDNTASCIVLSDLLYLMLLTTEKFVSFSPNPLVNSHQQTQVLNCLSCHSKAEVDELVQKALKAGGKGVYPSNFKMQNSAGEKSALGKAAVGSSSGSKATTVNAA